MIAEATSTLSALDADGDTASLTFTIDFADFSSSPIALASKADNCESENQLILWLAE